MPDIITTENEIPDEVELEEEDLEKTSSENPNDVTPLMPEDLPSDTILFDGGPTAGQIVEWKEEVGDVFITEISLDRYVIWRTINRREYKELVGKVNGLIDSERFSEVEVNMVNEEMICQLCCLYPTFEDGNFDKELAGMPSIISQQILECSGFRPIDTRGL